MLDFSTACNHRGYIIYIYIYSWNRSEPSKSAYKFSLSFPFARVSFVRLCTFNSWLDQGESRIRKNRIASFAVDRKKIDEDERKRDRGIETQEEDRFEEWNGKKWTREARLWSEAAINRRKIDVEPDRKLSDDPWRQRLFIVSLEEVVSCTDSRKKIPWILSANTLN